MTEIDPLLPISTNDTSLSQSDLEHEDKGEADAVVQRMISEQCAGQQTGLAVDDNFHSTESFNTTQENEASNTITDSKHASPSAKVSMSLTAPSANSNGGPSTPTVKKASA